MPNDNQVWYEDIMRKGTLRNSGMNEIAEDNWLDWERLRILENGKFVPAMAKGHSGAPSTLDISILRDAAQSGKLFLYRLGEEYPMQLSDGAEKWAEVALDRNLLSRFPDRLYEYDMKREIERLEALYREK